MRKSAENSLGAARRGGGESPQHRKDLCLPSERSCGYRRDGETPLPSVAVGVSAILGNSLHFLDGTSFKEDEPHSDRLAETVINCKNAII